MCARDGQGLARCCFCTLLATEPLGEFGFTLQILRVKHVVFPSVCSQVCLALVPLGQAEFAPGRSLALSLSLSFLSYQLLLRAISAREWTGWICVTVAQPAKIALPVMQNQKGEKNHPSPGFLTSLLISCGHLLPALFAVAACISFQQVPVVCRGRICGHFSAQLRESGTDQTVLIW